MEKNDAKCKGMQTNCKIVERDCRMQDDGNMLQSKKQYKKLAKPCKGVVKRKVMEDKLQNVKQWGTICKAMESKTVMETLKKHENKNP